MEPSEEKSFPEKHPLTDSFKEKWEKEFGNISSPALEKLWSQEFDCFDQCIKDNMDGKSNIYILPMITGSGKTQGMIHMCQNLPADIYALIVTNRTADADEIAHRIGKTACSFHSNEVREDLKGFVNKVDDVNDTLGYDTVVITHEQFKRMQKYPADDQQRRKDKLYHRKGGISRDLVIIDEQINLFECHTVSISTLEAIKNLFVSLQHQPEYKSDIQLKQNIQALEKVIAEARTNETKFNILRKNAVESLSFKELRSGSIQLQSVLRMIEILEKDEIPIRRIVTGVDESHDNDYKLKTAYLEVLQAYQDLLRQWTFSFKSGKEITLHSASQFHLQKSIVILDATATENHLYTMNDKHKGHLKVLAPVQCRKFDNLSIHIIRTKTGKEGIIKNKEQLSKELAQIIHDETTEHDKIMVVSFKGFLPALATYLPSDRKVEIDNWGNITGSNAYRDTNVQFIFGLNRKPESVHRTAQIISKLDMQTPKFYQVKPFGDDEKKEQEDLIKIKNTDLVQEIIQAIMRTQARKVIDADGNCDPTKVYLTLDPEIEHIVVEALERYLPGVKIDTFTSKSLGSAAKQTIANGIFQLLKTKLKNEGELISFDAVKKELGLKTREFNDATRKEKFQKELALLRYTIVVPSQQMDKQGRLLKQGKKFFTKSKW